MRNGIRIVWRVIVDQYIAAGKCFESQRLNEFAGVARHGYADFAPIALQAAENLNGLIRGDAASDAKGDARCSIVDRH